MNSLEDRLRAALHAHAEDFTAHPDAWQQLNARSRPGRGTRSRLRPGRGLVWSRFVTPAAAAVAVAAIVVGAAALPGRGASGGGSGARPTSRPASGAPAPPGRNDYLIKQDPPVSAIVRVKSTVSGQTTWTFVWFGRMKDNPSGTVLCLEVKTTGSSTAGDCTSAQLPAGYAAALAGGSGNDSVGLASAQVASVSAQWPGGRVAGTLISGRGFLARVWLASGPMPDNPRIVFRNAAGTEVGKLTITSTPPFQARPHSGGITIAHYPAGFLGPEPGTLTAYLVGGRFGLWASANLLAAYSTVPASEQSGLSVFTDEAEIPVTTKLVEFSGCAPQNVVRVTMRFADGRQFSARTIAGWPGSGLRLWSVPMPGSLSSTVGYVVLGYDAADQVVSQLTLSYTH